MEYIKAFLTNNIVIAWIAPIFTAIIATIIIKVFSIRKKNKEIKAANQKYADAIRPYVIQKIEINEQIIHGIRNAISMEFSVPEKYIYTDGDLRDMLMYDITTTRFMTEQGKAELIQNIVNMFKFEEEKTESYYTVKKINKKGIFFACFVGILGLVVTVALYLADPEEAKNPNSIIQFIMFLSTLISLFSLVGATWHILDILAIEIDLETSSNRGIIGSIVQANLEIIGSLGRILYGYKFRKKKSEESSVKKSEKENDNEKEKEKER